MLLDLKTVGLALGLFIAFSRATYILGGSFTYSQPAVYVQPQIIPHYQGYHPVQSTTFMAPMQAPSQCTYYLMPNPAIRQVCVYTSQTTSEQPNYDDILPFAKAINNTVDIESATPILQFLELNHSVSVKYTLRCRLNPIFADVPVKDPECKTATQKERKMIELIRQRDILSHPELIFALAESLLDSNVMRRLKYWEVAGVLRLFLSCYDKEKSVYFSKRLISNFYKVNKNKDYNHEAAIIQNVLFMFIMAGLHDNPGNIPVYKLLLKVVFEYYRYRSFKLLLKNFIFNGWGCDDAFDETCKVFKKKINTEQRFWGFIYGIKSITLFSEDRVKRREEDDDKLKRLCALVPFHLFYAHRYLALEEITPIPNTFFEFICDRLFDEEAQKSDKLFTERIKIIKEYKNNLNELCMCLINQSDPEKYMDALKKTIQSADTEKLKENVIYKLTKGYSFTPQTFAGTCYYLQELGMNESLYMLLFSADNSLVIDMDEQMKMDFCERIVMKTRHAIFFTMYAFPKEAREAFADLRLMKDVVCNCWLQTNPKAGRMMKTDKGDEISLWIMLKRNCQMPMGDLASFCKFIMIWELYGWDEKAMIEVFQSIFPEKNLSTYLRKRLNVSRHSAFIRIIQDMPEIANTITHFL